MQDRSEKDMAYWNRSFVEHVAVRVKDIAWHIAFFRDVLGMPLCEVDGDMTSSKKAWSVGGIQLISDPDFSGPEGRFAHLRVMSEDLDELLGEAKARGIANLPDKPNWLALPDGILIEVMQAAPGSVAATLAVDARAQNAAPLTSTFAVTNERFYEDAQIGDEAITPSVTVTEKQIMTYAELTGDYTPVHTDEAYARTTPFGTRVAHGLFGLSLADGLKCRADYKFLPGMSLGWTWDFVAPIKLGDTVHVKFHVGSMRTTKKPGWGIVVLPSELINQHGEVVQLGEHRLMIPLRPETGYVA
jgi:acyl dehydratase/catechol 2,3-dioxygenase-like lactoylglutathione lyase family enzyme